MFDEQDSKETADLSRFIKSREAEFRRNIRAEVRKGPFSRAERDVILAFMEHWFYHRNSTKGVVHPGRKKLAAKARVSIRTVTRTLDLLKSHRVIEAVDFLHGWQGKATEYTVDAKALSRLCSLKKADLAYSGEPNVPTSLEPKCPTVLSNIIRLSERNLAKVRKHGGSVAQ